MAALTALRNAAKHGHRPGVDNLLAQHRYEDQELDVAARDALGASRYFIAFLLALCRAWGVQERPEAYGIQPHRPILHDIIHREEFVGVFLDLYLGAAKPLPYNAFDAFFQVDEEGNTPLHAALRMPDFRSGERLLLCAGSFGFATGMMTARNNDGNTALHMAAPGDHEYFRKLLLLGTWPPEGIEPCENGGTPFDLLMMMDNEGRTPVHAAAASGRSCALESAFLHCQEDWQRLLTVKDNRGKTPLIVAAENRNLECLEVLLRTTTDLKKSWRRQDAYKRTALHYVIRAGDRSAVQLFKDYVGGSVTEQEFQDILRLTDVNNQDAYALASPALRPLLGP